VLNKIIFMVMTATLSLNLLAADLKDPTKPAFVAPTQSEGVVTSKAKTPPPLVLNSIKINGQHRSVIINQRSYQVGELVGRQRIKRILSNKVIFSSGKSISLFDDSFVSFTIKGLRD